MRNTECVVCRYPKRHHREVAGACPEYTSPGLGEQWAIAFVVLLLLTMSAMAAVVVIVGVK